MNRNAIHLLGGGLVLTVLATAPARQSAQQQDRERAQPREIDWSPAFVSIDVLNDATVINAAGAQLADVLDLIVDTRNGMVTYAVIETVGNRELGDKVCLVPYGALTWQSESGQFRLSSEPGLLRNLPPFDSNAIGHLSDESWLSTLRGIYGERSEFETIAAAQRADDYSWLFRERDLQPISGEVIGVNRSARSAMGREYYAVMINPQSNPNVPETALVLLAPTSYLEESGHVPSEGDSIAVNAVRAIGMTGDDVFVAKKATVAGKPTMLLRDDSGVPQWNATAHGSTRNASNPYWLASELINGEFHAHGKSFGKINDVVFEARSGTAAYAIVSAGGVLGIDDTDYAFPCGSFLMTANGNLHGAMPAEELKLAPKLSEDGVDDLTSEGVRKRIREFFKVKEKSYDTRRAAKWINEGHSNGEK